MHIKKVLNSSVVLLTDEKQAEFIVLEKVLAMVKSQMRKSELMRRIVNFLYRLPITNQNKS